MNEESKLVTSLRELRPVTEWFHDQNGQFELTNTTFAFTTADYRTYFGQALVGKWDLTTDMVNNCLKRILDEDIYPEASPQIKIASITEGAGSDIFIKGPKLRRYHELEGTGIASDLLWREVTVLERLTGDQQHPNIVRYHGCIVKRGRIVGIVLDRYSYTLEEQFGDGSFEDKLVTFDKDSCMESIESAVTHLHSLGLAHNDLNPSNIMFKNGEPYIIDFDSCQPLGNVLVSAGTPRWMDDNYSMRSAIRNDLVALHEIRNWLTGGRSEAVPV